MATKSTTSPLDHITPLTINGMTGRMMRLPAPKGKQREILVVYGIHASLERMVGMAEALNRYGAVTIPDLPGLGGMDSYFKIGQAPTIDNMADYLAAFVKLRYKKKRISILAVSLGFLITTRMLQKYPELAGRVDLLVSAAGFVHKEDLTYSANKRRIIVGLTTLLSTRIASGFIKIFVLRKTFIRYIFLQINKKGHAQSGESTEERIERINFEVVLWQDNDIRTYFYTLKQMFISDLCAKGSIKLPVYHVAVSGDQYLDNHMIEQHMHVIYEDFIKFPITAKQHAPTVIADAKTAREFIPAKLRYLLNKK